MKNKSIDLVCVGDSADFDSFKKLHRERKRFKKSRIAYHAVNYSALLNSKIPRADTGRVLVFLFFPFDYWNREIETRTYRGIYGSRFFYNKFANFFKKVECAIERNFAGRDVLFVNPPGLSARYRDKLAVKRILLARRICTPRLYKITGRGKADRILSGGRPVYIKVRYGSMGKGITYISPALFRTNFFFKGRKILSRKSDYGWNFRNIRNKRAFLRELLKRDVYIEEAVAPYLIKEKRFDMRVYVFFGKPLFVYPKSGASGDITTNITQNGQGEHPAFLRPLPEAVVRRAGAVAAEAAEALNLNFAGVDIIIDKGLKSLYVVDVNVFPGFPNKKVFNLARGLTLHLKRQASFLYP